ncbi:multidrug effflux MFS transporter [Paenochrobactrum sp. BZR 588]|uniref:multidrug effflux MFS transporter n=1 Tax=unclassified Paenochrobactrum TaxID=2639760 RepID=UPI003852280F
MEKVLAQTVNLSEDASDTTMHDTSVQPAPLMSERLVGVVGGFIAAIGAVSMGLYTPAMPEIVQAFGTTEAMVKLTLSTFFGGFCLAQLVCGPMADGWGRRPVTIGYMLIYLIASVAALLSSNIETLLVARFFQGVGAAVGVTVSRAMVRDLFTNEASARVMNLIGIVIAVGPAVSPTLGGLTMYYFGWHAIFIIMVLLGLAVVLTAVFVIRETGTPDRSRLALKPLLSSYGRLLQSRHFMYPCLAVAGATGALYTAAIILPFVLMQKIGLSPTQFGLGLLLQTSFYLSGGLLFRVLMGRFNARQLATVGYVIIGMASLLIVIMLSLFEPTYLRVMLPMACYAFGISFVMPQMTSAGMAPFPKMAGSASAMMGFFQMSGGLVGGAIAATMRDPIVALAVLIPSFGVLAMVSYILWCRLPVSQPIIMR